MKWFLINVGWSEITSTVVMKKRWLEITATVVMKQHWSEITTTIVMKQHWSEISSTIIMAWRTWVPRVQDRFLSSSPGVNGYGSVCHEPCSKTNISSRFFRRRGEGCHFRFRAPANHLASPSFPLVSGDLRLLSTNICWYPLCDLHSFLTVTFLTGCHCSFQRKDSINLISIVSVGYHVTLYLRQMLTHMVFYSKK